jgi:very-short-patch-repair endonuclease
MSKVRPDYASQQISDERRSLTERSRQKWTSQLIDFSRRNNLLFFRQLKNGTVDITNAPPEFIAPLLQGDSVQFLKLLPDSDEAAALATIQNIRRRALANLEEKGLDTLFLSIGSATWTVEDVGRPPDAPVLLMPLAIESRGREERTVTFKRSGEIQPNLALLQFLQQQFGFTVNPESLIAVLQGDDEGEVFDPVPTFELLKNQASNIKGFAITSKMAISNFSFQKMAMVRDLSELQSELPTHDVISAIAGDTGARTLVMTGFLDINPRSLDTVPADDEHLVLDADSSQQRVIAIVEKGQHCIIQGPPGTGKSQTISNLVASLAAKGKRVLFVAEKRAALSVVLDRLERIGLGHLALDLHGADRTRQDIVKKIADGLHQLRESIPVDTSLHSRFEQRRQQLNKHESRMHSPKPPSDRTLFQVEARLLELSENTQSTVRWHGSDLDRLTAETVTRIHDLLVEAGGLQEFFLRTSPSPWTGARLKDGQAAREAIEHTNHLAIDLFPQLDRELATLTPDSPMLPAASTASVEHIAAFLQLLESISETRRKFAETIFTTYLDTIVKGLQLARGGAISRLIAWCTNSRYRAALKQARALSKNNAATPAELLSGLTLAETQVREWSAFSKDAPASVNAWPALQAIRNLADAVRMLADDVPALEQAAALPMDELRKVVNQLASDSRTPVQIPRLVEIETALEELGLAPFVDELRGTRASSEGWPAIFECAWLSSILDRRLEEDADLAAFNGRTHDRFVEDFKTLDRQRIELARLRVKRTQAERVIQIMNAHMDQTALLKRESEKKRRHLPLRRLLAEAPDVLTALFPCWMASPLSVSQLLPPLRNCFDYVIFDEASQILPEDAIPSIYRGTYLVVAGDKNQLPPTTFFAASDDAEEPAETANAAEGFESLLDLAASFIPSCPLDWHYRSRDERLIAFSNHHIYGDRLVTFPGPGGPPCVSHILVDQPVHREGDEESAPAEVAKVVELVVSHAKERPNETLGVIAMGIVHANKIQAALDKALRDQPDLDAFFDQTKAERFFVKNLERVQGDERDAIILTVGYGKNPSGKLLYRFGPLLQAGGERRLNVAITRARTRMTLVSSFSHADMDPQKTRSRGVELLRSYIEYASNCGQESANGKTTQAAKGLELNVMNTLAAEGLKITPQLGSSKYRIDLAAESPVEPGRFLLAIECDGATYHASPTARDRDRLRQQNLEGLGWKFHRIWSTDWFFRRDLEVKRIVQAYKSTLNLAEKATAKPPHDTKAETKAEIKTAAGAQAVPQRGARPRIPEHDDAEDYTPQELTRLIRWIKSDGRLRTDDEIMLEALHELGFKRRGPKIEQVLREAIKEAGL